MLTSQNNCERPWSTGSCSSMYMYKIVLYCIDMFLQESFIIHIFVKFIDWVLNKHPWYIWIISGWMVNLFTTLVCFCPGTFAFQIADCTSCHSPPSFRKKIICRSISASKTALLWYAVPWTNHPPPVWWWFSHVYIFSDKYVSDIFFLSNSRS